ncbi:hypothetical protein EHS25_003882 [Saitozyma podzolica]|uniref:Uncharacterized protein n=1 Tax=Saitozyma podzolica TaxID=1890683 RepID=A0A427Y3S9_9TREE|nr:hypothetical protein EHS25_003882 [Saitozyma podzolica]
MPPQPTDKPSTTASPYDVPGPRPQSKKAKKAAAKRREERMWLPGSKSLLSTLADRTANVYLDEPGRIPYSSIKKALDVVYGSHKDRDGRWAYTMQDEAAIATRTPHYLRVPRITALLVGNQPLMSQTWRVFFPPLQHGEQFFIRADGKIVDVSDKGAPGERVVIGDGRWKRERREYVKSRMIRYRARLLEDFIFSLGARVLASEEEDPQDVERIWVLHPETIPQGVEIVDKWMRVEVEGLVALLKSEAEELNETAATTSVG